MQRNFCPLKRKMLQCLLRMLHRGQILSGPFSYGQLYSALYRFRVWKEGLGLEHHDAVRGVCQPMHSWILLIYLDQQLVDVLSKLKSHCRSLCGVKSVMAMNSSHPALKMSCECPNRQLGSMLTSRLVVPPLHADSACMRMPAAKAYVKVYCGQRIADPTCASVL